MEWLIVGLGNPGPRYAGTRHNVGREAVERLAARHGAALDATKFGARFGRARVAGVAACLAVPTTYMNESGRSVAPLARFYRVPTERTLVVYDDMDLPLGRLRLREHGGSGGHNGMRSIARALGSDGFPRLRIGIGRPPAGWDGADFVLARFRDEERPAVEVALGEAADAVEAVVGDGLRAAMNTVNA